MFSGDVSVWRLACQRPPQVSAKLPFASLPEFRALRLHEAVPCALVSPIQLSAWRVDSRNFALTEFQEVFIY